MFGIAILAAFFAYLVLTVVVALVCGALTKAAANRAWPGWVLGFAAMSTFLLWDLVAETVVFNRLCATEAHFTIYKTPEQWMAENPGVAETLVASKFHGFDASGRVTRFDINARFEWESENYPYEFGGVRRFAERIIDSMTGEVLMEQVDVGRAGGIGDPATVKSLGLIRAHKFWLGESGCNPTDENARPSARFLQASRLYRHIGKRGR